MQKAFLTAADPLLNTETFGLFTPTGEKYEEYRNSTIETCTLSLQSGYTTTPAGHMPWAEATMGPGSTLQLLLLPRTRWTPISVQRWSAATLTPLSLNHTFPGQRSDISGFIAQYWIHCRLTPPKKVTILKLYAWKSDWRPSMKLYLFKCFFTP